MIDPTSSYRPLTDRNSGEPPSFPARVREYPRELTSKIGTLHDFHAHVEVSTDKFFGR